MFSSGLGAQCVVPFLEVRQQRGVCAETCLVPVQPRIPWCGTKGDNKKRRGGKKRKEAGSEGKRVRAELREREREKRVSQKKTIGSAL